MQQVQINTIVVSSAILLWLLFKKGKEASAAELPSGEQATVIFEEQLEGEELSTPLAMPTIPGGQEMIIEETVSEPEYEEDKIFVQYPGLDIWIPRK